MISVQALYWILLTHYIADFSLQTNYMALNKSSNNKALGLHCLVYGLCFLWMGYKAALIIGVSHFIIDYVTSRAMKYCHTNSYRHTFFVMLGGDQFMHYMILFACYTSLYK